MNLTVLVPPSQHQNENKGLELLLKTALADIPYRLISDISEVALPTRLLVAVSLGKSGINPSLNAFLSRLREDTKLMKGSIAGMIVQSEQELYGKDCATQVAQSLNAAGCALVPRPLVESIGSLAKLTPASLSLPLEQNPLRSYLQSIYLLAERIIGPGFRGKSPLTGHPNPPKLLAVHVCLDMEPNLFDLWDEIAYRLTPFISYQEINLRQQTIHACNQCNIHRCDHFQPQANCFYGSALLEDSLHLLAETDALLLVCHSYHGSLHPQLSAFIEQISALMSPNLFPTKALYALVVSPHSGGDMVVKQMINALSLDGSFFLPPKFALLETASQPMEAISAPEIEARLDSFTHSILETLSLGHLI